MQEFADKLGWKIQKQDDAEVQQFCSEVGIMRQVFKVWMHNNKQAMKKKDVSVLLKKRGFVEAVVEEPKEPDIKVDRYQGHINHSIFWKNLAPTREGGGEPPQGSLGGAIETSFGSLEALIQKMNAEGAALQGSGWVWLAVDKELKRLVVETTGNQDPLLTKGASLVPLLGIDVWEHAYYLQNVRPDYLKNVWKVMNWKYAAEVYEKECP